MSFADSAVSAKSFLMARPAAAFPSVPVDRMWNALTCPSETMATLVATAPMSTPATFIVPFSVWYAAGLVNLRGNEHLGEGLDPRPDLLNVFRAAVCVDLEHRDAL